jgi:RIO kinase 1
MKVPKGLVPLVDDGVIDRVVSQLQSGKEAAVYIVECDGEVCCAKVYKSSEHRSFQRVAEYREGRKSRGSRDRRATGKRTQHGVKVQEEQWKSAEIEALYRLADVGVRVPQPRGVIDGVLLMELICDAEGVPASRLNEVDLTPEQAREWHTFMIEQIVKMLCAGLIHGDLSEFNVLAGAEGPVIIDLPQAVDASGNNNAFAMLARDVANMRATFARAAPELMETQFAIEMWDLFEAGNLEPDTVLTGQHSRLELDADVEAVLDEIAQAQLDAETRELVRDGVLDDD